MSFSAQRDNTLVITFDDSRTQLDQIRNALRKGGIKPVGKPVYLEKGDVPPAANRAPAGPGPNRQAETGFYR